MKCKDKENPRPALKFIQLLIHGTVSGEIPAEYLESTYASDADIIIELGTDYAETKPNDIFYLYYPVDKPVTTPLTNEETSTESADAGGSVEAQPQAAASAQPSQPTE